jgi:squalene-hopene/tetraprenyl-beta-curcumene cyclase
MKELKRLIVCMMIVLLVVSTLPLISASSETQNGSAPNNIETSVIDSMSRSVQWLESTQAEDGTWSNDLGVTAMVTLALLNAGRDENNPSVSMAIEYILDHVQLDGSITAAPTYSTYYTSVCMMALSSTTNTEYETIVSQAAQFIIESQITSSTTDAELDWVGGYGYGGGKHSGRPDISNTQFALMALHSSQANFVSIQIPQSVWDNAIGFLTRCQNLVETNPSADNPSSPSYNDGGFIYYPGFSKAGEDISYGSSTSAGIWGLFLSGLDAGDARIKAGLEWLNVHYSWDVNPNMEAKGLYNYFWGAARVNTFSKKSVVIDQSGTSHVWFDDLANKLMDIQVEDGYWINQDSDWFWENIPELATAYALLALETQTLSPFSTSSTESGLEIELDSGTGDLHIYDNRGGHLGIDYDTGELENTIAQGTAEFSTQAGPQNAKLSDLKAGGYYVNVVGNGDDEFNLKISSFNNDEYGAEHQYTGQLSDGSNIGTSVVVTSVEQPLTIFASAPGPVPVLATNTDNIVVEPGQTLTYLLELEEVGGVEDVNDIGLSHTSNYNTKVTFEDNDFDLDANGKKFVKCTIEVPDEAEADGYDDYVLIESGNAVPIMVQLELETQDDESSPLNVYQITFLMALIGLGIAALVFIVKKKK